MNQLLHLQPYFNIRLSGLNADFAFADVSQFIDEVIYEEQADLIRTLTFTIGKFAEVFINHIYITQDVTLYGGYIGSYAKIFVGKVQRVRTTMPNDGAVKITVECMSTSWTALGKDITNNYVYPDVNSTRRFAKGKSLLTAPEIVRGIVEENNMQMGTLELAPGVANRQFSVQESLHQNRVSDWALLKRLADKCNATIWTEFDKETEKLFFVDRSMVRNTPSNYFIGGKVVSFVYPLRELKDGIGADILKDRNSSFYKKYLDDGQILMFDVSMDQDIASMNSISYGASHFNMETGEQENYPAAEIIKEKDKSAVLRYYELDDAKVAALERDNPAMAKQLRSMNPTGIPWDIVKQFLKHVDIADEDSAIYDQAFFGITINATINGDIHVRSQRAYSLYGVLNFSSIGTHGQYWLYSLKHRWAPGEFLTDLVFKK